MNKQSSTGVFRFPAFQKSRAVSAALMGLMFLMGACASVGGPTPTLVPTRVPSVTPSKVPTVQAGLQGTLDALTVIAPTLAIEETNVAMTVVAPTLQMEETTVASSPELTPTVEASAESTEDVVQLPPVLGQSVNPPLDINLPKDWKVAENDALIIPDVDGSIRSIPFVAYSGPIKGGTGTIVLLWGFPSLVNPFGANGTPSAADIANAIDPSLAQAIGGPTPAPPAPDLWSDGLRLLRLAIVEQGCNIGTDLKRTYSVGSLSGVGTQFAAVNCPDKLPDTRGWFVGLDSSGLNFIFYMYSDPIAAMDTGHDDLQAILDTVTFHAPDATPEATP